MSSLSSFIVLFINENFPSPEAALFKAEDEAYAKEQMLDEDQTANIIFVINTTSIHKAFSAFESANRLHKI